MSYINDQVSGEQVTPAPSVANDPIAGGGHASPQPELGRLPMIIYLNPEKESVDGLPPNPWKTGGQNDEGFEWGGNTLQEFADRLVESNYFDDIKVQQPMHNDLIAGLDKNDQTVVLKVVAPIPKDQATHMEQQEAPEDFKS